MASDAVHDALLQVWRNSARFDPERGNADAWLISLVRYRALDIARKQIRETPGVDIPDQPDTDPDALSRLVTGTESQALRHCLEQVEAPRRSLVMLAFIEGLTQNEVSARVRPAARHGKIVHPPGAVVDALLPAIHVGYCRHRGPVMSETAEDPTVTAGEYVLGLLDTAEMRQVEARAAHDQVLACEINFWEDRLAPLAALVSPVPPPPVLWSRLALATGVGGKEPRRRLGSPRVWQATTAAALAIAACFAYIAFLPRPLAPDLNGAQFVAALGPTNGTTPFLAQTRADGSIAITRLASARPAASGHDYQLWALPSGATRPISLGVIAADSAIIRPTDRPSVNEQLLVSDEPTGGSTTGLPTGAVLWGGTLTPVSPPPNP